MQRKKWEAPFCLICDYWRMILLVLILVLIAALTSNIWRRLTGLDQDDLQVSATQTALVGESIPIDEMWKTFSDLELGYSIQYPSSWEVSVPESKQRDGYIESVVLAEYQGTTSQTRHPNENARVLIMSYPKEEVELETWVIMHWNWLDGQLNENQIQGFRTISVNVVPAESTFLNSILWVERENDILCFWAQTELAASQNETIVNTMFDRITFLR